VKYTAMVVVESEFSRKSDAEAWADEVANLVAGDRLCRGDTNIDVRVAASGEVAP